MPSSFNFLYFPSCFYCTSTKSWRGCIFIAVCLRECIFVSEQNSSWIDFDTFFSTWLLTFCEGSWIKFENSDNKLWILLLQHKNVSYNCILLSFYPWWYWYLFCIMYDFVFLKSYIQIYVLLEIGTMLKFAVELWFKQISGSSSSRNRTQSERIWCRTWT